MVTLVSAFASFRLADTLPDEPLTANPLVASTAGDEKESQRFIDEKAQGW